MNKIQLGKMYLVKELFWLLVPTKELAGLVLTALGSPVGSPPAGLKVAALAYQDAKWIGEQYNCNVCVVAENSCFVLLEQDEACFKVLDSKGNIGWIGCRDFSDYFELVKE